MNPNALETGQSFHTIHEEFSQIGILGEIEIVPDSISGRGKHAMQTIRNQ
jgi:hypothetical protein